MAGVKTLADGQVKVTFLASAPADIDAVEVSEATAGTDYQSKILYSDFDLGPTGSDTIPEKSLDARGNAQTFGLSNYGGGFTVFRYFDATTGAVDPTDDALWAAVTPKGTTLYMLIRENGKLASEAWAAGDEYRYFEVITDEPVRGERSGYIKYRINCAVQYSSLDNTIDAS